MQTTPKDLPRHLRLNQFTPPTNRIGNLCYLISGLLLADVLGFEQELIIEILLRLPVKSLSRFKCVSKSWLRLISSQKFIRSHYSRSSEPDQCLNSQVLGTLYDSIEQFSLYSALYEPSVHVSLVEHPSYEPDIYPFIVGIVNGLVCLLGTDGLILWNPVLRKAKHLPNLRFDQFTKHSFGFGYDEANDDYKVVFVEREYADGGGYISIAVKVYSLLTDSWKIIDNFKSGAPLYWWGTYANGKIYWLFSAGIMKWKIVSLDMLSEKYGELQQPDYEAGVSDMVLGVTGGRLLELCYYGKKRMDLWVMDKYGVEQVWSKVVSIPSDNVHLANPFSRIFCLCILRNGDIVLAIAPDLVVYHPKHNEFRKIEFGGHHRSHLYVESLVSPHGSGL